jgi:ribonuclease HII
MSITKNNRYFYENQCYTQNKTKIAGLDEVGRGCWAGPLVVAACILPAHYKNDKIRDSKKICPNEREKLFNEIKNKAIAYEIVFIDSLEVDKYNPKQASILGMEYAIKHLKIKPDHLLIDAEKINSRIPQTSIIHGDDCSISIAAASILAKVSRDRYMVNIHQVYPQYNFKNHKGYGTKEHLLALKKYGPIKNFHRFSYKPIINLISK